MFAHLVILVVTHAILINNKTVYPVLIVNWRTGNVFHNVEIDIFNLIMYALIVTIVAINA